MTPDSLAFDGGTQVSVENIAEQILNTPAIEGLTVSGGEPFVQADALGELLEMLKARRNLGVIIYTGYLLTKLQEQALFEASIGTVLAHTDLLIDGPYLSDKDDGLSLRGSWNQKVHAFTARYGDDIESNYGKARREAEIHVHDDGLMLVGIAGAETRRRWERTKKKNLLSRRGAS